MNSKENHSYNFRINADSTQAMEDLSALEEQIAKVQKRIDDLNKSKTKLTKVPVIDPTTGEPQKYTSGRNKGKPMTMNRRSIVDPNIGESISGLYHDQN